MTVTGKVKIHVALRNELPKKNKENPKKVQGYDIWKKEDCEN